MWLPCETKSCSGARPWPQLNVRHKSSSLSGPHSLCIEHHKYLSTLPKFELLDALCTVRMQSMYHTVYTTHHMYHVYTTVRIQSSYGYCWRPSALHSRAELCMHATQKASSTDRRSLHAHSAQGLKQTCTAQMGTDTGTHQVLWHAAELTAEL